MELRPAIFVLGPSARELGSRLASHLEGTVIETDDLRSRLHCAFREGRPIIGLCASGILIRLLAPLLTDKSAEPPVIALAEDGSIAVPLLGGHRGPTISPDALRISPKAPPPSLRQVISALE